MSNFLKQKYIGDFISRDCIKDFSNSSLLIISSSFSFVVYTCLILHFFVLYLRYKDQRRVY